MIKNQKPKISILILSYNHFDYIEKCIESVFLNQSESYDLELIVLDDGSEDGSIELLQKIKNTSPVEFKLLIKEHGGVESIARNFNELIELASGEYIAFLASDDEYTANRFEDQVAIMQNNDDCVIVYGNGINIESGEVLGSVHPERMHKMLLDSSGKSLLKYVVTTVPHLFIQSILVRGKFIKASNSFDPDLIADDWVFNIKILRKVVKEKKSIRFINKTLFLRNLHDKNTSRNFEVHFIRVKQVAERYAIDSQSLMRKVVADGLIDGLLSFDDKKVFFFVKKSLSFPALIPLLLFGIARKAIMYPLRRLRLLYTFDRNV